MLGHDDFSAAGDAGKNIDLIHECLHQKDATAGFLQHVSRLTGIGNVFQAKPGALIDHVYHQFVFVQLEDDVDFPFAALLVAVCEGIHDAFVDREADFILVVLSEPGDRSDAHTHFFGQSYALDQRLQNDFHPLRF